MKFLANRKLATRISIITTAIIFAGMLLLWFIVSSHDLTQPSIVSHSKPIASLPFGLEDSAPAYAGAAPRLDFIQ